MHDAALRGQGRTSLRVELIGWITQFLRNPDDHTRPLPAVLVFDRLADGRRALVATRPERRSQQLGCFQRREPVGDDGKEAFRRIEPLEVSAPANSMSCESAMRMAMRRACAKLSPSGYATPPVEGCRHR
jgi:hypothetical protein